MLKSYYYPVVWILIALLMAAALALVHTRAEVAAQAVPTSNPAAGPSTSGPVVALIVRVHPDHPLFARAKREGTDVAFRRLCAQAMAGESFADSDIADLALGINLWSELVKHPGNPDNELSIIDKLLQVSAYQSLLDATKNEAVKHEVLRCALISMRSVEVAEPEFSDKVRRFGAQAVFDEGKAWLLRRLRKGME